MRYFFGLDVAMETSMVSSRAVLNTVIIILNIFDINPCVHGRFFRPIIHGGGGVVCPPPITHIENGIKRFLYIHIASLFFF